MHPSYHMQPDRLSTVGWLRQSVFFVSFPVLLLIFIVPLTNIPNSLRLAVIITGIAMQVVIVLTYGLMNLGHYAVSGYLLSIFVCACTTVICISFDGIRNGAIVGYFVAVLIARLFLQERGAISITALSLLAMLLLFAGERNGWYPVDSFDQMPDVGDLAIRALGLTACAFLLQSHTGQLQQLATREKEAKKKLYHKEKALRESQIMLELRVRQRTVELQSALDSLQNEMAQRKDAETALVQAQRFQSLGTLSAGVAHDVKNVLNIVTLHTYAVKNRYGEDDLLVERIMTIETAAMRAAEALHQLTDYAGAQVPLLKPVWMNMLVEETLQFVSQQVPEQIDITFEPSADFVFPAIPSQVQQVLVNLIINGTEAIDGAGEIFIYTVERCLTVEDLFALAYVSEACEPGRFVVLGVRDSGSGMVPETAAQIFNPLFTTKLVDETYAGRGLGLAAVQRVVNDHGGGIALQSELGHGTLFEIYFPLDC